MAEGRLVDSAAMSASTLHCPSCGDEYVAGSVVCSDCRVALVAGPRDERATQPEYAAEGLPSGYAELGAWPLLATAMIVRRLVDADVEVSTLWSDPRRGGLAVVAVPEGQLDFADAVLRELPVDDEMPAGTPESYVDRIETRLTEIGVLLDELRQIGVDPVDRGA